MLSLAGTAASGIIDLISSLKKTTDSGKNKSGAAEQSAFLPVSQSASADTSAAATTATSSSAVSSETMRALLWLQSHGVDMSSSILSTLDSDGSGDVSKSEFETMFAKSGDTTKADAAFAKLDTDTDGAVSAQELAAGLRSGRHHHGPPETASADADSGDSSQTARNADGSTTTTITYSDGSQVTMTRPAASADSGAMSNLLERLIQRQADMLTRTTSGQSLATAA